MKRDFQAQAEIRDRLVYLRSRRGLTQNDVANRLGKPRLWYLRRENGKLHISAAEIEVLEAFFGESLQ